MSTMEHKNIEITDKFKRKMLELRDIVRPRHDCIAADAQTTLFRRSNTYEIMKEQYKILIVAPSMFFTALRKTEEKTGLKLFTDGRSA